MGVCASAPPTSPESARIDAQLRAAQEAERAKIKLLLLGTGESERRGRGERISWNSHCFGVRGARTALNFALRAFQA